MSNKPTDLIALVAGGAGFIGANLCADLLRRGYVVHCLDNLVTGQRENVDWLVSTFPRDQINFIEADVCDLASGERRFDQIHGAKYSVVYNLACPTGVPNIKVLGEEMLRTCSIGSINLLDIARRSAAKYLYTSSAEVYGDPEESPQSEQYSGNVDPVGQRSAYEEGKRFGEAIAALYTRKFGLDTRIVRVFNTYGPRMNIYDQRVIPRLLRAAMSDGFFTMFGDGSQTRSFLFVDDLIAGFAAALNEGGPGQVVNIGGNQEQSIADLHRSAELSFYRVIKLRSEKHFILDHKRRCADTSRIEALGWSPTVSLAEGLRRSLHDFELRSSISKGQAQAV